MNWEAVGAISEGLGAIAVFVTLAYLGVQVRYTRAELRRSIYVQRQEAGRELALGYVNNDALLNDLVKAEAALGWKSVPFLVEVAERTGLTQTAALRVMWSEWAWWYFRAAQIPYVDELPRGERVQFEGGIRFNYGERPLGRLLYASAKPGLNPDAVRYIESVLAHGT